MFTFPEDRVLEPGAFVEVWSGRKGNTHEASSDIFWTRRFVWNNNGDTSVLVMPDGKKASIVGVTGTKVPRKGTKADLLLRIAAKEAEVRRTGFRARRRHTLPSVH